MDSFSLKKQLKHCKKQKHEVNSGRDEDRNRGKHKVDVGGKMGRRGRDGGKKRNGTKEQGKEARRSKVGREIGRKEEKRDEGRENYI